MIYLIQSTIIIHKIHIMDYGVAHYLIFFTMKKILLHFLKSHSAKLRATFLRRRQRCPFPKPICNAISGVRMQRGNDALHKKKPRRKLTECTYINSCGK